MKRGKRGAQWRRPRCQGKVCYPTERSAIRKGERCTEARGTPLRAYECPRCGDWHLTKRAEWPEPAHLAHGAPAEPWE